MKKFLKFFLSFFAFLIAVAAYFYLGYNLHEVDPGLFYRSAQMTAEEFEDVIQEKKIKTVINLRGPYDGVPWYEDEKRISNELKVRHYDVDMSAKRIDHRVELQYLFEIYRKAERPILVHCRHGADRAGLASVFYQMLHMNKTVDEALDMLTLRYRHVPIFAPSKRYFFDEIWRGFDWFRTSYYPCKSNYKYYLKEKYRECKPGYQPKHHEEISYFK